eukprot:1084429-Pelagomonas_calceolata.AAC.1
MKQASKGDLQGEVYRGLTCKKELCQDAASKIDDSQAKQALSGSKGKIRLLHHTCLQGQLSGKEKKRKDYASQVQLRALRK